MRAACQGLLATGPLGLSPSLTITTQASTALRSQAATLWAAALAQRLTAVSCLPLASLAYHAQLNCTVHTVTACCVVMTIHAFAGKTGLVFVFVHACLCSGLLHLIIAHQTDLLAMPVRASMAWRCAKPNLGVDYTLAWYLVKRLGLSNDVCMCR